MFKLLPLLAHAYSQRFVGLEIFKRYDELMKQVHNKDFSGLDIFHHLASGFKATFTQIAYDGIDYLRQCCGGAGFSSWSGFTQLIGDYSPQPTFEGDNTVMTQQSARYIMKTMKNIHKGFKATGLFKYLNNIDNLCSAKCAALNADQLRDMDLLRQALQIRAAYKIRNTFKKIAASTASV